MKSINMGNSPKITGSKYFKIFIVVLAAAVGSCMICVCDIPITLLSGTEIGGQQVPREPQPYALKQSLESHMSNQLSLPTMQAMPEIGLPEIDGNVPAPQTPYTYMAADWQEFKTVNRPPCELHKKIRTMHRNAASANDDEYGLDDE